MDPQLRPHHQRVVDRLTERFRDDPLFPAIIVGGSIVKGRARDDSDVDIVMIATDEEVARRAATGDYFYFDREMCDYPGGYVDGKVVPYGFLLEAADHGSEPARSAFINAFPAYSRIPGLQETLARIPVYPEAERAEKLEAFYSQVALLARFFVREAEKRNDAYLMAHATADLALFAARLILAWNRILYPYHKWLMADVARAPEKPDGFVELLQAVLQRPGSETAGALYDAVRAWQDWGVPDQRTVSRFIEDTEWTWRQHRPALSEW